MYVGAIAIVMGLFAIEIATNYAPAKLSVLFLVCAWFPLLAIHEAGHAVAARLCGGHVRAVVIGFGRTLWSGTLWGVLVEVRALPIEGFTLTYGHRGRLRGAFVYFAGPGAELLVAGALLAVLGPEAMFSLSEEASVIAMQAVALGAVVSAVINLIPAEARDGPWGESRVANDGLGILRSLFGAS